VILAGLCFVGAASATPPSAVAPAQPALTSAAPVPETQDALLASFGLDGQGAILMASNTCCLNAGGACADRCSPCTRTFSCTPVGSSCTYTCRCNITPLCQPQ
jgi:hypothetical protein